MLCFLLLSLSVSRTKCFFLIFFFFFLFFVLLKKFLFKFISLRIRKHSNIFVTVSSFGSGCSGLCDVFIPVWTTFYSTDIHENIYRSLLCCSLNTTYSNDDQNHFYSVRNNNTKFCIFFFFCLFLIAISSSIIICSKFL